jgi:hypothetical protein
MQPWRSPWMFLTVGPCFVGCGGAEASAVMPANAPTTVSSHNDAKPSAPPTPQIEVKDASGALDPTSAARLGPARGALERCRPGNGGKVDVRVSRQERGLLLHVEPGPSLDAIAGHCTLEALSTIDLEPSAGSVGGFSIPPTGFTSLITISW